jgi:hypothetical protein
VLSRGSGHLAQPLLHPSLSCPVGEILPDGQRLAIAPLGGGVCAAGEMQVSEGGKCVPLEQPLAGRAVVRERFLEPPGLARRAPDGST